MTFFARLGAHTVLLVYFITFLSGISSANESDSRALNWAYQSGLGDGVFIGTPGNARIYNIPISYTLNDRKKVKFEKGRCHTLYLGNSS